MLYYCTSIVDAIPMTKGQAEIAIGRKVNGKHPEESDGFLITEGNGYKHWSPKKYFHTNFRPADTMDFSEALRALKSGKYVTRNSWDNNLLWLRKENEFESSSVLCTRQREIMEGANVYSVGCICLYNKEKKTLSYGWIPQQEDMMATDWQVCE